MKELKTSVEAILNGKKIVINKLKAGKYYQAQQIYVGMIEAIRTKVKPQASTSKEEKDTAPEVERIGVNTLYSVVPQEVAKLVAFCVDADKDKLLEEAYPEEISDIAEKVIELNNFNENLKKSVAPMASLGAAEKN